MNSRLHYIYDLKRLLSKGNVTDESRLNDNHLGFLIDQRRAKEIRDSYKRSPVIEPVWIQDCGAYDTTLVNRAEDQTVSISNCKFSKVVLPQVVSIMDPLSNISDLGTYSIRSVLTGTEYNYISSDKISLLHSDGIMSLMKWYTKIGNAIYITPQDKKIRALLILDSPLDGYILDNSYIKTGSLTVGITYIVAAGNVTHNNIKYNVGETFVAVNNSFTGLGKIQFNNQRRLFTNDDPYPMSHTMAEIVKMKILTQDFGFEASMVADTKNDSTDDAIKRS